MEGKRSGKFVGAFPSYGYIKNSEDNHKLIIDKESAGIVRKIFEWKVNEGLGNLSICHRLNDMGVLNPTGYKKEKEARKYEAERITYDTRQYGRLFQGTEADRRLYSEQL